MFHYDILFKDEKIVSEFDGSCLLNILCRIVLTFQLTVVTLAHANSMGFRSYIQRITVWSSIEINLSI